MKIHPQLAISKMNPIKPSVARAQEPNPPTINPKAIGRRILNLLERLTARKRARMPIGQMIPRVSNLQRNKTTVTRRSKQTRVQRNPTLEVPEVVFQRILALLRNQMLTAPNAKLSQLLFMERLPSKNVLQTMTCS